MSFADKKYGLIINKSYFQTKNFFFLLIIKMLVIYFESNLVLLDGVNRLLYMTKNPV